jgi:hypothetical protein
MSPSPQLPLSTESLTLSATESDASGKRETSASGSGKWLQRAVWLQLMSASALLLLRLSCEVTTGKGGTLAKLLETGHMASPALLETCRQASCELADVSCWGSNQPPDIRSSLVSVAKSSKLSPCFDKP